MLLRTLALALLGVGIASAATGAAAEPTGPGAGRVIIAYVFPRGGLIDPASIDATKITHVNYAFANCVGGRVVEGSPRDAENFLVLAGLRKKHPHLKLLVSVGGWTWSKGFSDAALTEQSRKLFVESALAFVRRHQLDGFDLDWEYPGMVGDGNVFRPEDKQNFTALMADLRQALDQEGQAKKRHLLLTFAAAASSEFLEHTEMAKVQASVDFVNLMTYDFRVASDGGEAGHHANLYPNPSDPRQSSVDRAVREFLAAGVPASKLVLGVPFYGRAWSVATAEARGLYRPGRSPAERIETGYARLAAERVDKGGFERIWDEKAQAPYLWNADRKIFISYEDPQSLRLKCGYIREARLAGAMFWEYYSDPSGVLVGTLAQELLLGPVTAAEAAEPWPWWRGPLGNGVSPDGDPPVRWSEKENVRFKVPIEGNGLATPIVWGDRIYVLSALSLDRADEGPRPAPGPSGTPLARQRYLVTAYDRHDGSVAWQRVAAERVPHEEHHLESGWATASPVTDGQRLYAHFGSAGTYAYTLEGERVWKVDLGDMTTRLGYGEGSSPALWGDTLVINWDHEGDSFVVALDARTGAERWRRDRPGELTSWSTPLVVEHEGRVHVIVAAAGRTRGYDLRSGELLWSVSGLGMNVIPTPTYDAGVLYLASGKRDSPRMLAVDLRGARGDLDGAKAVLWTRDRDTPYVSSPLLYRGQLYFFKHVQSFLTSVDAATGKTLFTERVGLGNVFASPVAAAGRIYLLGRQGKALVLEPGPTLKVLAESQLDDGFDASPVVVGGDLYLRGRRFLYALAVPPPPGAASPRGEAVPFR